jgi:hypothetical protein
MTAQIAGFYHPSRCTMEECFGVTGILRSAGEATSVATQLVLHGRHLPV